MNARTGTIMLLLVVVLITGIFVFNRQEYIPTAPALSTLVSTPQPSPTSIAETSTALAPTATETTGASSVPMSPSSTATPPSPLAAPSSIAPALYDYRIVNTFPHDRNAFTQGLVYLNGVFYEGTGLYGRSSLRKVELESGLVLQQHDLDEMFFGEGIAVIGDKIYQLTWQNGVGFVYDRENFQELQQFTYATEGWGLTYNGHQLIMSDGTPNIYFLDPDTLQETRRITVTVEGERLPRLNELEYVDDKILANVWQTDFVVRIDPETGIVDGVYDFSGLLTQAPPFDGAHDVLNGIAYDEQTGRLFVTGKLWPYLFEVEIVPR